ncbi:unnamed protein product [Heterobilharzia americana]|nr:unnamed protein product [Heterobilharzia americana]
MFRYQPQKEKRLNFKVVLDSSESTGCNDIKTKTLIEYNLICQIKSESIDYIYRKIQICNRIQEITIRTDQSIIGSLTRQAYSVSALSTLKHLLKLYRETVSSTVLILFKPTNHNSRNTN